LAEKDNFYRGGNNFKKFKNGSAGKDNCWEVGANTLQESSSHEK